MTALSPIRKTGVFRHAHFMPYPMFEELLEARRTGVFRDETNEADGVVYPRICRDVPAEARAFVEEMAQAKASALFMRESPEGVHVPQQAHHDLAMGRVAFMLYLDDGPGGTAFLRHRVTGICYAPRVDALVDMLTESQNEPDHWEIVSMCERRANKACMFDAGYYHRAEPIGGHGVGPEARCVLSGFFP